MNSPQFLAGLALSFVSGAAALSHQVLWTRRLVDLLGASAGTFSKVIGAFFLGLAFGAWLASRPGKRGTGYWPRVAFAEFGVAALAIPVLFCAVLGEWIHGSPIRDSVWRLVLPLLLVSPPATMMGLVVPWMIRALMGSGGYKSSQPVWLYGVNTLGGVAGLGLTLLWTLPKFGLSGAMAGAIGLNLLVACGALALRRVDENSSEGDAAKNAEIGACPDDRSPIGSSDAGILAFTSGFLVLALEVALQHQLAQVSINSLFSSAIVLTMVLISLTGAAVLAPCIGRRLGGAARAVKLALLGTAVLCAIQPFVFSGMRSGVNILPYELPPMSYIWAIVQLGLPAVCPIFVAGGLVFPLLLQSAAAVDGSGSGPRVARLFAWNGLGGWLGAELGQSVIVPAFGLWGSIVLLGAGYAVISAICGLRFSICANEDERHVHRRRAFVTAFAVTLAIALCAWFVRELPQATVLPGERLAAVAVGREGVVATLECGPADWRMLFNNSYTLGGSKARFNQERQAHLPLLLHGSARSVATLGVATGGTVAGAALHTDVERIDAVELSPLVLQQAERFFGLFNRAVFADRRVRFIEDDARWVIARERAAYDVVIGDLFLPWRTGESRLFTREHFENVRRSLKPGGLFCQWLPLFQLTRPQFDVVARTFREVFPDAFVVRGDFYCDLPIIGLVGGRDFARIDWQRVRAGCERLRTSGSVTDPLVRHAEGVAMMMLGPLPDPGRGPVNNLAGAWLEWDAGRNILGMRTPWFLGVPCAEYVRDIQRASAPQLPPELRVAHEAGQFFLTLEVAAKLELPARFDLESQIPLRLPPTLANDRDADWRQWPMRIKPKSESPL